MAGIVEDADAAACLGFVAGGGVGESPGAATSQRDLLNLGRPATGGDGDVSVGVGDAAPGFAKPIADLVIGPGAGSPGTVTGDEEVLESSGRRMSCCWPARARRRWRSVAGRGSTV